ncbi:radical SAM protein [Photobacterium damselae]|uniref:radical SAM protein n=1 Tax=Photobacterium damselae TaxID=38293 RepID=UPI004068D8C8
MIVAYIKISDFCNIGCSHCYLPQGVRNNKTVMSVAVLSNTIVDLKRLCAARGAKKLNVIWHGGEPLLLDPSLVVDYMEIIKGAFATSDTEVSFSIQTSLIPLNNIWIDVIKNYFNSSVSTSVDFSSRTINGSPEKYMSVLDKRLETCKKNEIDVAANVVVSKSELGMASRLIQWFVDRDIMTVEFSRFNAYSEVYREQPTNREHSIFLSDVIDAMVDRVKRGLDCPQIPSIDNAVLVALKGESSGVWGGRCLTGNYVVNPDGKTHNCPDRISFDSSLSEKSAFSESLAAAKIAVEYSERSQSAMCSECEYRSACRGGCPIEKNNILENGDCSGFKTLLNYIKRLYENDDVARMCMDMVINRGRG